MGDPMNKYEITDIQHPGNPNLFRIRALRDIELHGVKAGDLGGYIEYHGSLSQEGDCWVADDAKVSGHAWVTENAKVYGNAVVYDNAMVYGKASISGNALVYGNAYVSENAVVSGNARVLGDAKVYGDAAIYGNARVYGNAEVGRDDVFSEDITVKPTDTLFSPNKEDPLLILTQGEVAVQVRGTTIPPHVLELLRTGQWIVEIK